MRALPNLSFVSVVNRRWIMWGGYNSLSFSQVSIGAFTCRRLSTRKVKREPLRNQPALNFVSGRASCRACGIVGLPNVGKSTLFNALTESQKAQASNFPFCTIDPNVGHAVVPDSRLDTLAKLAHSKVITPAQLEIVDIAGLVKGASEGKGLGNQFLSHIRSVSVILHVVRCFDDPGIHHVEEGVDPVRDINIINQELLLADLISAESTYQHLHKKQHTLDGPQLKKLRVAERVVGALNSGQPAGSVILADDEEFRAFRELQLLTAKPVLYVCNVAEDEAAGPPNRYVQAVQHYAAGTGSPVLTVSARLEAEVATTVQPDKRDELLALYGLQETGLTRVVKLGRALLRNISFYTVGEKEARCWTIVEGTTAAEAAGKIHSDFQKGFIKAETISYEDYVACGGEKEAKRLSKMRLEGPDYICQDGDIFTFRFQTFKK